MLPDYTKSIKLFPTQREFNRNGLIPDIEIN